MAGGTKKGGKGNVTRYNCLRFHNKPQPQAGQPAPPNSSCPASWWPALPCPQLAARSVGWNGVNVQQLAAAQCQMTPAMSTRTTSTHTLTLTHTHTHTLDMCSVVSSCFPYSDATVGPHSDLAEEATWCAAVKSIMLCPSEFLASRTESLHSCGVSKTANLSWRQQHFMAAKPK